MYADRVDAAAKTSIKDRLNGNSIGDSARLRHITGKRQRQDDKWEHDLYDDGGPRVSNHKIDARDLRLKLQRKSFQQASPRSGVQDLREKLSGTMNSQPANVIFVEGDSNALIMPAKKSNKRKGMNQEQEVAKKNKNPQLSKSQKRKLKKLEEENEKTLLLSKSIETLEKYKIPEDAFSLLQSSRNISRVETVKEKRRMAVQFSKAGLSPQGDQPFKRNHETASFEIEAGLDEIQSKMHMDEKGHLQPMVIGREVQNHASFSLVCHNPVSGNELGLNGRSVSALSAE